VPSVLMSPVVSIRGAGYEPFQAYLKIFRLLLRRIMPACAGQAADRAAKGLSKKASSNRVLRKGLFGGA